MKKDREDAIKRLYTRITADVLELERAAYKRGWDAAIARVMQAAGERISPRQSNPGNNRRQHPLGPAVMIALAERKTYSEIAAELNVSRGVVAGIASRCREYFRLHGNR